MGGSLGRASAQNAGRTFGNGGLDGGIASGDQTDGPGKIETWEELGNYLHRTQHAATPPDTLAMMVIADHNKGEIVEREEHDRPITLAIALNKTLNNGWSFETGLQYSMLNSRFTMGENGFSMVRKQRAHYVGVPLRLSRLLFENRHLAAYATAGVTLHIPVYGKNSTRYTADWHTVYTTESHFAPPLQWQTGIAFSLQYKFTKHVGLFVEPTINWFIPSGSSTRTVWTEHKMMFTSPAGIRITW